MFPLQNRTKLNHWHSMNLRCEQTQYFVIKNWEDVRPQLVCTSVQTEWQHKVKSCWKWYHCASYPVWMKSSEWGQGSVGCNFLNRLVCVCLSRLFGCLCVWDSVCVHLHLCVCVWVGGCGGLACLSSPLAVMRRDTGSTTARRPLGEYLYPFSVCHMCLATGLKTLVAY